jgi:hypothetical protein
MLTLIRYLNILFKYDLIKSKGNIRVTRYLLKIQNSILRNFDVEKYFADDTDRVLMQKIFNFNIFENLHNFLSLEEIENLQKRIL